ncbi:Phospholipid methyltransferase [Quadrisphaera granulorum]|uniref:Phospholipid methyltransferase n=1 Tax=Quadrisphaera granulorum TaxID=317664 RepID=A0A316A7Z0_9ACTN|nr:isoprenylcysteine carboxylmethyltransferase family protein [Quadrisphaera granulorum]PWJ53961.1 phospholipid methyltransferase [Quadrisphaera granulorum]SZE96418.1 Phospholipid methyltransferase [Quadrisphaera granulorum]
MALDRWLPWSVPGRATATALGLVLIAAGVTVAAWAVSSVVRHRTTIVPHHAVTTLLTTGPFARSRNPMYTGLAVIYLGVSFVLGSLWPVVLLPGVLALVGRLVVHREEAYLAVRFGAQYDAYREHVRRWI